MRVNLFVANHGKPDGIEDHICLISKLFGERGIPVQISSELRPNELNLIIDEFTNYLENHKIVAFKQQYPEARLVLILTEFIERKWGIVSFNNFGGFQEAAALSLLNVYLRLVRDDFPQPSFGDYLTLFFYTPFLIIQTLLNSVKFLFDRCLGRGQAVNPAKIFIERYHRVAYFHMRYLGLKAYVKYADAILISHERIIDGFQTYMRTESRSLQCLGVLYPEFNEMEVLANLLVDKKLFIEITGSVTRYRQKWLDQINRKITTLGIHHLFQICLALPFAVLQAEKPVDRGAYSLHPPQSKNWPYSSPTRIYRALAVDNNLPILTRYFAQNPIEDICFLLRDSHSLLELYEMYHTRSRLIEFIAPRIKTYNEIVHQRNDMLVEKFLKLLEKQTFFSHAE